jgi:carbonic anhydrase/acetyltransferase-like protein (isoleucine patch superfamily)
MRRNAKPNRLMIGAQSVLADGCIMREMPGEEITVLVAKGSELHTFAVIPKRWGVERRCCS